MMNRYVFSTTLSLIALPLVLSQFCVGQEPADAQSTADLRREVTELRATVAELTKRLEAMEYQKIPRAGMPNPELASPKLAELSDADPGSLRYTGQPATFPVDVFQLPQTNPAPRRHLPPYLLFPEAIERAMMNSSKEAR